AAGARITGKASQAAIAMGTGVLGHATGGALIASSLIEAAVHSVLFIISTFWVTVHYFRSLSFSGMKKLAVRYIRFPLYTSWSGLLNTISLTVPAILVAAFFGMEAGGYYSRALALTQVPMFFLGDSIRDVFFQWASARIAKGEDISTFIEGIVRRLIGIILLPMLMVMLIGPEIFVVVAGKQWLDAGVYSRILAPWMFFGFISMPLGMLLYIHERQNVILLYNVFLLLARCATLAIGGSLHASDEFTLFFFSLASTLMSGWVVFYALRLERVPLRRFFFHTGSCALFSAPTLLLTALGKWGFMLPPLPTLILGAVSSVSYWWLFIRHDPEIMARGSEFLGRTFGITKKE
ncbi:MAG: oligosaccharide flippase family protein, partial [Candidatus Latescibacterota bacterium]